MEKGQGIIKERRNLESFDFDSLEEIPSSLHKEIILKLIEIGKSHDVIKNLEKFQKIDKDTFLRILKTEKRDKHSNKASFGEILRKATLEKFLENSKDLDLDENMAVAIIEIGSGAIVANNLPEYNITNYKKIASRLTEFNASAPFFKNIDKFPDSILDKEIALNLIQSSNDATYVIDNLIKFQKLDGEVALALIKFGKGQAVNPDDFIGLNREKIEKYGKKYLLTNDEAIVVMECIKNQENDENDKKLNNKKDQYQENYELLISHHYDWQDPEINERFEKGAMVFGYDKMFKFARVDHRHDALFGFDRILELQEISGLDPNRFYHNILQQVAMDAGSYGENNDTSYQTLNNIAQGFQSDIEETLAQVKETEGIPQLGKLVENLNSAQDVFSSWKMLIQYKELTSMLESKEILGELSQEQNLKLREYVSTLLFHPSVTDTHAVKMFWKDPYEFFGLESSHTSRDLHNLKKPSNYIHIPNLDLAPTELRDALVDGALDKIQTWQPLEITYMLPANSSDLKRLQKGELKRGK